MATFSPDLNLRRSLVVAGCTLLMLLAAMAWSGGAAAAKPCAHCKAKAAKAGKGKKRPVRAKAGKGGAASPAKTSTTIATPAQAPPTATPPPVATPAATVTSTPESTTENSAADVTEVREGPRGGGSVGVSSSAGCGSSTSAGVTVGMGTFSGMVRPSSCWRPYASSSPFNTPIAASASGAASSSAQVSRLVSGGAISYMVAGDPYKDYGTAVYYPTESDPTYTIHCREAWGVCAVEGEQIHLPAGAIPSGPWPIGSGDADSHMTIVDQRTGWEYDLWNVREIGNGTIVTGWGGKTQIEGSGLGSDAVAAQFGSLAGIIRPSELKAGRIDHALALTIPCTVGFVAPATKGGLECADAGMPTANAMPMGAHLQLQMSTAEIEALHAPAWKRAILQAFATYGAYVEDTTGASSQWGLKFESPNGSISQGGPDEYVELAESLGLEAQDYNGNGYPEYWFDIAGGVNWNKLRVVG